MPVQVKHSSWVFKQVFITKREGGGWYIQGEGKGIM